MHNPFIVAKFGGTSVANVDSIDNCVQIIKESPETKIIVVSAQSGITNLLVKLATKCETKNSVKETLNKIRDILSPILANLQDNQFLQK